jgi:glycosyltransferase involved in cell wall biosynthesis
MGLIVRECDREGAGEPAPAEAAEARIILTGLVPPTAVPDQIALMDVLAHPSYREGLPRTVPQALLCGVPPVAYDVDGTREACIDGETGLLVPLGDRAGLRTAVERLANDTPGGRELRRALGRRGREHCRVAYAAKTMVAELEKVYATALDRAGGSTGSSYRAPAGASHGRPPDAV